MKNFFTLFFLIILVSGLSFAQDTFKDEAGVQTTPVVKIYAGEPQYEAPVDLLYDNGGLVNFPGGGFGGADASVLETALGLSTYGFGAQTSAGNSMADDFVVPAPGWQLDEVMLFAYQTGSTTTSTITEVRVQIWDGDPTAGGTVIFGDLTTNRMTNTTWSNIYRSIDTAPLASNRPIMVQTASLGVELTPGTYWIEYQFNGTLSSGPWAPPITILATPVTGNAKQNQSGTWVEALSGTFAQGMPFILMGTEVGGGGYGLPEVLYYLFDETGGTQTTNYAVPGRGAAVADVLGGLTMGPTGQFDAALIGSGGSSSTDYVNTGWATDIGTSSWTIGLWLNNLVDVTNIHYIFGDNTASSFRCFYNGVAPTGGVLLRRTGMTDVPVSGVQPGPTVVHFVYDATIPDIKAYVNGVLSVTVPQAAQDINGSGPFKVGGYSTSNGMEAGGLMDEFRFYDRALDAAEVAATWNISVIPVELTSFTANVTGNDVELLWETASETNNSGFSIERMSAGSEYTEVGFVPGFGTTSEPKSYSFEDNNLRTGTYTYRLKQIDFDGTFEYSNEVEVDVIAPAQFSLDQNYPNPFNPSTKIAFSLATDSKVSLKVFDVLGQEVASLINQDLAAGVHNYDFNASGFNSGVYFYRIEATGTNGSEFVDVKKMILVK